MRGRPSRLRSAPRSMRSTCSSSLVSRRRGSTTAAIRRDGSDRNAIVVQMNARSPQQAPIGAALHALDLQLELGLEEAGIDDSGNTPRRLAIPRQGGSRIGGRDVGLVT